MLQRLNAGLALQGRPGTGAIRAIATPLIDTVGVMPYARIGEVHMDVDDPMPMHTEHLLLDRFGAAGAEGANMGFGQADLPAPADYHTRVDVNGDGHWDKHTYVGRADGGVDILADMNHDGRADFIGHDYDRDGLVDAADYDKNRDGVFETHMFDDNGDGWMDRRIISPEPEPPSH